MNVFERRRLVVGLGAFVVLFLIALAFAIPKIEDSRTAKVEAQLASAGINGVSVDFSGRDGTLTGPAADKAAALAAVKDRYGIRSLTYHVQGGAASPPTTVARTTAPPSATTAKPAAAPSGLSARVTGTGVLLTGPVVDATEKASLAATAAAGFGTAHVQDQTTPGAAKRDAAGLKAFDQYRSLLGALGSRLQQGTLSLANDNLAMSGAGFTKEAAAALNQRLATAHADGVATSGTVQDPPAEDAAGLQTTLSNLVGRAGINFAPGSAVIDVPSRAVLDTAAQAIQAGPAVDIEINGYTDNVGSEVRNLALSRRRAQAVRLYLIGRGATAAHLTAKGLGSANPVADNSTAQGRRQNRRIEFTVMGV